jgi:hypothetical protein
MVVANVFFLKTICVVAKMAMIHKIKNIVIGLLIPKCFKECISRINILELALSLNANLLRILSMTLLEN